MNTFLSVNSQLTAQPHVFAPFDGPRRVCTRYEKFEERGHAHLPSITSIRHEKVFQVFTFDIDVHRGPRYAINSEESDAPSVTKMALGVTIRSSLDRWLLPRRGVMRWERKSRRDALRNELLNRFHDEKRVREHVAQSGDHVR